jgi:hypothetical protein
MFDQMLDNIIRVLLQSQVHRTVTTKYQTENFQLVEIKVDQGQRSTRRINCDE